MAVPFSIRCVSCNGRLRVTDEAIVGSIVACPRCGSMVQIAAPENTSTTDAIPPRRGTVNDLPVPPPMVVGDESVDSQEMTQDDVLGRALAPPVGADFVAPLTSSEHPSDWQTDGEWSSEPSQRIRKRWMIGVAATGGLIVAAILGVWTLSGPTKTRTIPELISANDRPPLGETTAPSETSAADSDDAFVPENSRSPDAAETAALETNGPVPPPLTSPPLTSEATEAETAVSNVAASIPGVMPPDTTPPPIPSDLFPADILGGGNAITSPQAQPNNRIIPEPSGEAETPDPLMDLPPELQAFTGLLDLPGNAPDALPATPLAEAADDELMVNQAAEAAVDPMLLATPPLEVNIDNALKLGIAIQTDGYPLAAFVLACSEITTLPIQIDWVTLDLADVSLSQKIRDSSPGSKPIGTLIDAIAGESGVVFEREENRLFLTLGEDDFSVRLQHVLSLDDFGQEKQATQKWVDRFVESTQWSPRERLGLRALVTDSLRRARSMPPKLSEPARSHWTVLAECLASDVEKPLDAAQDFPERWPLLQAGDAGPQLDTSITLAGLLRQISRRNSTTCVVNWDDARQRRLSPGQLVMPFADQPAGEMLAETLAPMGLQIRVADASHWWVGTAATYDRMPLLVIGDPLGPRRDEILERIGIAAERAGTLVLLQHDPVSDRYLTLMPRFLYRQLPTILKPFIKK